MSTKPNSWWIAVLFFVAASANAGSWEISGHVSNLNSANAGRMYLSVSDESGTPVTGLKATNFKVGNFACDANGNDCGVYAGTISSVSEKVGSADEGVYVVDFKGGQRTGVVTSRLGLVVVRVGIMQMDATRPGEVRGKFVQHVQHLFVQP